MTGLTVVEASGDIATRYCGKLFVEHGALVVAPAAPDNAGLAYGGASAAAYAAWLDSGKQREFPDDAMPDIVIAGQTPADIARAGGLDARLLLALTWFGPDGPCADWRGSDGIIQAMSGLAYGFGPAEGPPCLPQGHAPQVVGGLTGFIAALAALRRGQTGRIDVSIHEAFLCLTENAGPAVAAGAPPALRRGVNRFGPVYPQTIFPVADGWIGVTALTPQQWLDLCSLIGLPDLAQDPRYATTDLRLAAARELDAILAPALTRLNAADLLIEGQRRRIPLGPVPTLAALLATPHWRARGSFRSWEADGAAFEAPAVPFRLHPHPGAPPAKRAQAMHQPAAVAPLGGLRVLDLSMGWSGPLAGRHFADLGAEVIKVEGTAHLDWWRGWNALEAGDPPPYETRPNFNAVNRNKRGITLDLRRPAGVALLKRLAIEADVLVENYAPGVLDKLGLSAATLAGINPALVYISMGAVGSSGPWSGFRAYGSTTEQASGMPFQHGEAEWPPAMQHTAYGDPIAGLYAAAACLIALHGRDRTGGTTIDLAQVECLFHLAADAIIAQSVTGEAPPRTGSHRLAGAWRGCLRGAGPDAWLAVEIERPEQMATLAHAIGSAATDPAALIEALAAWARNRSPRDAAAVLQTAGVLAGPVVPATDLLTDPHVVATGFYLRCDRRHVGNHVLPQSPYRLDGKRAPIQRPAPTLGEHGAEVLATLLGLTAAEIAGLEADGIIGTRAA